jgi:hypothetical protein
MKKVGLKLEVATRSALRRKRRKVKSTELKLEAEGIKDYVKVCTTTPICQPIFFLSRILFIFQRIELYGSILSDLVSKFEKLANCRAGMIAGELSLYLRCHRLSLSHNQLALIEQTKAWSEILNANGAKLQNQLISAHLGIVSYAKEISCCCLFFFSRFISAKWMLEAGKFSSTLGETEMQLVPFFFFFFFSG